jgi:hypothetical protein
MPVLFAKSLLRVNAFGDDESCVSSVVQEVVSSSCERKTPDKGMQGLGRISAQLDLSMNILEAKTDAGQYLLVGEQMVQELAPVANLAVFKDELQGDVFMEQTFGCAKEI